jgi:hypothetical protein
MSEEIQATPPEGRSLKLELSYPPLPWWLARRLLRRGEEVRFVRGPKQNPWWERYLTHPAFFLIPATVCAFWGCTWGALHDPVDQRSSFAPVVMGGIMLVTLSILAITSGHFTRLVVTNYRLFVVQGYEIRRGWDLKYLPKSLLHYSLPGSEYSRPVVNLDALQSMLGPPSEHVAGAKAILAFGKHLDAIKAREKDKP